MRAQRIRTNFIGFGAVLGAICLVPALVCGVYRLASVPSEELVPATVILQGMLLGAVLCGALMGLGWIIASLIGNDKNLS
jgi:hypothetical protein